MASRAIATVNVAALVCASSLTAAFGLVAPALGTLPAAGLVILWAAVGAIALGPLALAAALPVLALMPGGGWVALAGWTGAGIALGVGMNALREQGRRAAVAEIHNELREAAHERGILERNIERYPVLLEACLQLSNAREPDPLAQVLCERARQIVPEAREILVYLGTPSRQSCRASAGIDGKPCPREAGPEHLFVAAEARSLTRREGNLLRVMIPLRDRRQAGSTEALRGVLEVALVFSEVGERMSIELLHALGRLGGLGLATVDLVNQARSLALHDDLTGLYGQHEFLRRLEEQVGHARRYKYPLGVVMCDMDHLKKFNDKYGHPAGDAALKAVAKAILGTLPPGGMACRYGGEEFAALVPELDETELREFAERLRHAIATSVPDPQHKERKVTASIGFALVKTAESGREALDRADAAGYRAKANGRNRIEAAT